MKSSQIILLLVGALSVIGVGAALVGASRASPALPKQSVAISPRPAPDFTLKLFSGKTITLKDFSGKKPVVINFWASWCPPCRDEAPALAKVSKLFEGRVEFIGVVTKDTPANAQAFMNEFGITYDNGIDQDDISSKFGITGIPETFWIDRQGQIVDRWIGAIDEANLASRVQKLFQNQ